MVLEGESTYCRSGCCAFFARIYVWFSNQCLYLFPDAFFDLMPIRVEAVWYALKSGADT